MFKKVLAEYTFTAGATVVLSVFVLTFICILYLGFRKKSQPAFNRASKLPLMEDET